MPGPDPVPFGAGGPGTFFVVCVSRSGSGTLSVIERKKIGAVARNLTANLGIVKASAKKIRKN